MSRGRRQNEREAPPGAREIVVLEPAERRRSIGILDHKLSDPAVVALLRERRAAGVSVSVLGRGLVGPLEPHGKLIILDESQAVIGSLALSTLSLDFHREVAVVIDDSVGVRRLNASFHELRARAGAVTHRLPGD